MHLATLLGLLVTASLCDLETRRIPNPVSVALALSGLGARLVNAGPLAALDGVVSALAVLGLLWLPWRRGWLGGADVKVAMGAAVWIGLAHLPHFVFAAALAGGPLALACWLLAPRGARADVRVTLWELVVLRRLPRTYAVSAASIAVPYSIAVAAGASVTILVGS